MLGVPVLVIKVYTLSCIGLFSLGLPWEGSGSGSSGGGGGGGR